MTGWEQEALGFLPLILEGGRPPRYATAYGGIDRFNAQLTARKQRLSLPEVLGQFDLTHRRLIDYMQQIPEGQFAEETRFRRRLRLDRYGHYRTHAEAIGRWRERLTGHR